MAFLCLKCPTVLESVSTMLCLILYLLIMASFTIRGSLPKSPTLGNKVSSSSLRSGISGNSSQSVVVSIQMAKAPNNSNHPPQVIQPQPQVNASKAPTNQKADLETKRWETTEILKVRPLFFFVVKLVVLLLDSYQLSPSDCNSCWYTRSLE